MCTNSFHQSHQCCNDNWVPCQQERRTFTGDELTFIREFNREFLRQCGRLPFADERRIALERMVGDHMHFYGDH